ASAIRQFRRSNTRLARGAGNEQAPHHETSAFPSCDFQREGEEVVQVMHVHWVANFVVPPPVSFSGGDRIMVECLRRWVREHRVTLYGSEATRQLAEHQKLERVEHVTWPSGRWSNWPRPVMWAAQTFIGKRHAREVELP